MRKKDLKTYLYLLNYNSIVLDLENKEVSFSEKDIDDLLKSDLKWALIVIFPERFRKKISNIVENLGHPPFKQ